MRKPSTIEPTITSSASTHVALCGQSARLLVRLLGALPSEELRFGQRERLRRLLARLRADMARAEAAVMGKR